MTRYALLAALVLAGCGGGPLSLLTGGGPNVAANVQAGAENRQSAVAVEGTRQSISRVQGDVRQDTSRVRADAVQTVVVNEIPAWLIVAFAVALLMDSPLRWPGQIMAAFRRR